MVTAIETVVVEPTKEMPIEVYRVCHRLSFYMELMQRLPDGRVLWDDKLESVYDAALAEAEHLGLRCEWFRSTMELPKKFFEEKFQ